MDAAEFDDVFVSLLPRLYARVALVVGSRQLADDLVQDVYVRLKSAAHRRRRFVEHPNPYGYALATAVNLARAQWRSRGWHVLPLEDDLELASDGGVPSAESWHEVTRLLRALTVKEAAAVVLVDLDGCTLDEAAVILGVHKGTVQRNRIRALAKLRERLAKREPLPAAAGMGDDDA